MDVHVSEEPITSLADLAQVPIAFEVSRVFDIRLRDGIPAEFVSRERILDVPYAKDYDAIAGEGPTQWARRFDVSNWGLIVARAGGRRVGGAVIAWNTPGMSMLEGRSDLAVLWDIRVAPDLRGKGVGSALFRAAESWAVARGCRQLKVETQNINVTACRLYARQGCRLAAVHPLAYPEFPEEIQMLWCKDLPEGTSSG